ncbi:MAG: FAD:protein transferase [Nevskia sp.]|nr:FAD:protein transferase [Nevskia sp.]
MIESRRIHIEPLAGGGFAGRFEAMASPCEVLADGADERELSELTGIAAAEVWRIERHWSRYLSGNIVDRINTARGRAVKVDDETAHFLSYAQQLYELSDGLFDVTSGVLRRVWKFDGSDRLPDAQAVEALLPLVGWSKVQWQPPLLKMKRDMQIDFGGIGKEYAVDRACTLVSAQTRHPLLVNCGGDLAASAPRRDGQPWLVGIDAQIADVATPVIRLLRGAVATSGDAHRFLLKDGMRYPHILNPKTGWPVLGGPRVVTVAADTCTEAGVLSTLALLHGAQAAQLLQKFGADSQLIW